MDPRTKALLGYNVTEEEIAEWEAWHPEEEE